MHIKWHSRFQIACALARFEICLSLSFAVYLSRSSSALCVSPSICISCSHTHAPFAWLLFQVNHRPLSSHNEHLKWDRSFWCKRSKHNCKHGELTYFVYIKNIWNNWRVHRPSEAKWTKWLCLGRQRIVAMTITTVTPNERVTQLKMYWNSNYRLAIIYTFSHPTKQFYWSKRAKQRKTERHGSSQLHVVSVAATKTAYNGREREWA